MADTQETGLDWVRNLVRDIKELQIRVTALQEGTTRLSTDLSREQTSRLADVGNLHSLHERLSEELRAQAEGRCGGLETRASAFEAKAQGWVAALGKAGMLAKEHLARLEESTTNLKTSTASLTERMVALEGLVPTNCGLLTRERDFAELTVKVSGLGIEVARDREDAAASHREVVARAARDVGATNERLDALQNESEVSKATLTSSIVNMKSNIDALQTFAQSRASATDFQALEFRVRELVDYTHVSLTEQVNSKASTAHAQELSDRLAQLVSEAQRDRQAAQAEARATRQEQGALGGRLGKAERLIEADREASSNCYNALEKELATKTSRVESEALSSRLRANEDIVASLCATMETKASSQEQANLHLRVDALQASVVLKAEAEEVAALGLASAQQGAHLELLHKIGNDHAAQLGRLDSVAGERGAQLDAVDGRTVTLEAQVSKKAEWTEVYSKDGTGVVLQDFYRKEEVDALLHRVWWRVGDMSKGRPVTRAG